MQHGIHKTGITKTHFSYFALLLDKDSRCWRSIPYSKKVQSFFTWSIGGKIINK